MKKNNLIKIYEYCNVSYQFFILPVQIIENKVFTKFKSTHLFFHALITNEEIKSLSHEEKNP